MDLPLSTHRIAHRANPAARHGPPPAVVRELLPPAEGEEARREIASWPGYAPTPLVDLRGLAAAAGLGRILYKHEASRFGLGSFKALGGAYAVLRVLQEALRAGGIAEEASSADLRSGRWREETAGITVTCATDGNHGRSVAWGARMFGCRCVIYLHETVSAGREEAIARFGAEIRRVPGTYDDAVRQAAEDAAAEGWIVVSDTSYPGYLDIPRNVMLGYTVMVEEILEQLPAGERPTHLFLQGGVGGLAAAVAGRFWQRLGAARPRVVVVEPDRAACLYESAARGRPTAVSGDLDTVMAGLACGEPSLLAWRILELAAEDFTTLPDEAAVETMRLLAFPPVGDPPLVAGESAVAGLAAALLARRDPDLAAALDLDGGSRVLLIGSEGATDPETWRRLLGVAPEAVEEGV